MVLSLGLEACNSKKKAAKVGGFIEFRKWSPTTFHPWNPFWRSRLSLGSMGFRVHFWCTQTSDAYTNDFLAGQRKVVARIKIGF